MSLFIICRHQLNIFDNGKLEQQHMFLPQLKKLVANGRGTGVLVFNGALQMWPKLSTNQFQFPCQITGVQSRPYIKQFDIGVEWHNTMEFNPVNNRQNYVVVNDYDVINCGRGLVSYNSKNDQFFRNKFSYLDNIKDWINPDFINASSNNSYLAGVLFNTSYGFRLNSNTFERAINSNSSLNYQDTIYDMYLIKTAQNNSNNVISRIHYNQFVSLTNGAPGFVSYNVANYFYGSNNNLSFRCNTYTNKYLSYLFYGNYTAGGTNTSVEGLSLCDGNNTHTSYPNVKLVDERVMSMTAPPVFEVRSSTRYSVLTPCVTTGSNGSSYIRPSSTPGNICQSCTPKTTAEIYCPPGSGQGERVVQSENYKDCYKNSAELDLANKIIANGFDISKLSEQDFLQLNQLLQSGCMESSLRDIVEYSIRNIKVNEQGDQKNVDSEIELYPNPSDSELYFKANLLDSDVVLVFNSIDGKNAKTFRSKIGSEAIKIRTDELSSGVYFVTVIINGVTKTVKKIVVIH